MSTPTQVPPPKGTSHTKKQNKADADAQQFVGRQLEPYFDDSVAGDAIGFETKAKHKQPSKKPPLNTPRRSKHKKNGAGSEQGYHSESGTAHYMNGSKSSATSVHRAGLPTPMTSVNELPGSQSPVQSNSMPVTTTPAKQAYAGPNFLVSPAASKLPMPKAFARGTHTASPAAPEESRESPGQGSAPAIAHRSTTSQSAREGSPLDFLFDADKAERLRSPNSSGSPLSTVRTQPRPGASLNNQHVNLPAPKNPDIAFGERSNREKFLQEIDGTEDQSDSTEEENERDAASTYKQQMDALRNKRDVSVPVHTQSTTAARPMSQDAKSEALKRLLFNQPPQHSDNPLSTARGRNAVSVDLNGFNQNNRPSANSPSSVNAPLPHSAQPRPLPASTSSNSRGSTSGPTENATSPDIKKMEDDLRKFLKIGR